ncbi:MAG: beta-propeller domain-containing protein [Candidatus Paceibacterota bacterium]
MNKIKKIAFGAVLAASALTAAIWAQAAGCDPANLGSVEAYQKGDAVTNLQSCLIDLRFGIPAGATGYYGGQTVAAVKQFYASWFGAWDGLKIGPQGIANLKKNFHAVPVVVSDSQNFKVFVSADDFKNYFKKTIQETQDMGWGGGGGIKTLGIAMEDRAMQTKTVVPMANANVSIDRVSETNAQVSGIDEPDIVKTDGTEIYYSGTNPVYWWGVDGGIASGTNVSRCYDCQSSGARIIKAMPVKDMRVDASIEKSGDMLLSGNILAIFGDGGVTGYNIANPANPLEKWRINPEGNTSIIGSRLRNGKIYMVTRTIISAIDTCPIRPLSIGGAGITIPCSAIYHPKRVLSVNAAFSVFKIDAATGMVENKTSFAGFGGSTVIYMSAENIYITYPAYENEFAIYAAALKDLLPSALSEKIARVSNYDISSAAKMTEINSILSDYESSLSGDDRLKFYNERANKISDYRKSRKRDLDRTIVAKIGLGDFRFYASGTVPGQPLNQFSLDEYRGNLRIATTVGNSWFARGETVNDVYVLDSEMKIVGSVLDLGKTEKIYSVRFIEDKGYVVTFRQTDPFYVIDLADARNPKLAGELKIPGYSGYLHPVNKDKIIGIGMENSSVKISYFNVSNPANPVEMDKYILDEHWSEAVNNHHAFLMDSQHGIFFMPGGNGGYIFSYKNDRISLIKAVSGIVPKRAVYVNDYLYMVGDGKIVVINENTWENIQEFEF